MPYLTITKGAPATGQSFEAVLCDDGRERRPVTCVRVSEHWVLVGGRDWRQVTSVWVADGKVTICVLPSRLNAAERIRQKHLQEAVAAGLALRSALGKLDAADQGRARLVSRQLSRWIEITQAAPNETPKSE